MAAGETVAIRASHSCIASRRDDPKFADDLRALILRLEGFSDEVIFDMIVRHVRLSNDTTAHIAAHNRPTLSADAQLRRTNETDGAQLDDLVWLLTVLLGVHSCLQVRYYSVPYLASFTDLLRRARYISGSERATPLVVALVDALESGLKATAPTLPPAWQWETGDMRTTADGFQGRTAPVPSAFSPYQPAANP